jgi:hypothetical protein
MTSNVNIYSQNVFQNGSTRLQYYQQNSSIFVITERIAILTIPCFDYLLS